MHTRTHARTPRRACVRTGARAHTHARTHKHTRSHKSLGELVNLMSVDVQRMTDLVPYLHNLAWSSPLQVRLRYRYTQVLVADEFQGNHSVWILYR